MRRARVTKHEFVQSDECEGVHQGGAGRNGGGVKYRDLPSDPGPSVVLRCEACDVDYSATRGDYFLRLEHEALCHCGAPMVVRERVRSYRKPKNVRAAQPQKEKRT